MSEPNTKKASSDAQHLSPRLFRSRSFQRCFRALFLIAGLFAVLIVPLWMAVWRARGGRAGAEGGVYLRSAGGGGAGLGFVGNGALGGNGTVDRRVFGARRS